MLMLSGLQRQPIQFGRMRRLVINCVSRLLVHVFIDIFYELYQINLQNHRLIAISLYVENQILMNAKKKIMMGPVTVGNTLVSTCLETFAVWTQKVIDQLLL